jgi:hypothetical protein
VPDPAPRAAAFGRAAVNASGSAFGAEADSITSSRTGGCHSPGEPPAASPSCAAPAKSTDLGAGGGRSDRYCSAAGSRAAPSGVATMTSSGPAMSPATQRTSTVGGSNESGLAMVEAFHSDEVPWLDALLSIVAN